MTNKNKIIQNVAGGIFLGVFILFCIFFIGLFLNNLDGNETEKSIATNWSEYENLSVIYRAFDIKGNQVTGENYYGIFGLFSLEKPIITGNNNYRFWVKNESYFVIPNELVYDEDKVNQSIDLIAIKKQNITFKLYNKDDVYSDKIILRDYENDDRGNFILKYTSNKESAFPFGAIVIFEMDAHLRITCDAMESWVPGSHSINYVTNRAFAFELSEDKGEFGMKEIPCTIYKYKQTNLTSNKIYVTVIPNDAYLERVDYTETFELMFGVEDKYLNKISKPIYEGEIEIQ